MFIKFFYGLDEIPVERHSLLRNLEGCEQAGGGAVIGQSPAKRWRHPVGVKRAKRMTFTGTERGYKIVKPNGPVVVIE